MLKYDAANVDVSITYIVLSDNYHLINFEFIYYEMQAGIVINIRIGADMKSSGKCRLVSNPIFHTQSYSYVLPKNSRYTKAIDREY